MIIVCDTNVFVRDTHLLRKKGGQALLQYLRAIQGRLFIPEILHKEYIEQTQLAVRHRLGEIEAALSALQTLVGREYDHKLPQDDAVARDTQHRLDALESLTLSEPLADELLAAAGKRSMEKKRPATKSDHGYKDCIIWECILRLPEGSEVRFVSRDNKGFYDGDRLSEELLREAQGRGINVVAHRSVNDLLQVLQADKLLDSSTLEAGDILDAPTIASGEGPTITKPSDLRTAFVTKSLAPGTLDEINSQLAEARRLFDGLDLRILGFIGYLGTPGKDQLFELLSEADIALPDAARNVAERLVIGGFVRDTGNHYFVPDRNVGDLAAAAVEDEIITLLTNTS